MPPTMDPLADPVRVARHGMLVTISLHGRLDAHAGVELLAAVRDEITARADRIDLDVQAVDDWTPEGARALRRCRRLARTLPDGLHYRTCAGAGHEALLEAYNDDVEDDDAAE